MKIKDNYFYKPVAGLECELVEQINDNVIKCRIPVDVNKGLIADHIFLCIPTEYLEGETMKVIKDIEKSYRFSLELDEHEMSMFMATLGITSLPSLVHKSFPEYKEDELKLLYEALRATMR